MKAVGAVARAEGYVYIFDTSSDAVVYVADNKDDIKDAVYKKLGYSPLMTTEYHQQHCAEY